MPPHILVDELINHSPRDDLFLVCCMNCNWSRPAIDCSCEF